MTGPIELVAPSLPGALCAETDPEAFFPGTGDNPRPAKRVCAACPVREPCLDWALQMKEQHGVWGGLSPRERNRLSDRMERRKPIRHGTEAGYRMHLRRKDPACGPCREGNRVAQAQRVARRAERGAV